MRSSPKTIQIFLPGGDPEGIRVGEITTRILQVIEVPRSLLSDFFKMPESNQVALYFLISESDAPQVYIGQTGDLRARLTSHNKNKEFWERALIVVSRTNSLNQTHGLYLEWHCIQAVRDVGRYSDENGTSGTRPIHRLHWKSIVWRSSKLHQLCLPHLAIRYSFRSKAMNRATTVKTSSSARVRRLTHAAFTPKKASWSLLAKIDGVGCRGTAGRADGLQKGLSI